MTAARGCSIAGGWSGILPGAGKLQYGICGRNARCGLRRKDLQEMCVAGGFGRRRLYMATARGRVIAAAPTK